MDQESHRQDPEEFYVKQDRIGSPVCTLIGLHYLIIYPTGKGSFGEVYKG